MNDKLDLFKKGLINKNIAVIGIGVSNTPLIKFLKKNGADVTAFDKKPAEELGYVFTELSALGVKFCLGEDYLSNLNCDIKYDIVFKTPGMRYDIQEFLIAKANGSTITSEMEVFFDLCPAQIIAVTGSDGKTTTTSIIYEILKREGYTCWLGGNIGKPLLSEIENIKSEHKVVLELSSFQLHTMKSSPDVAVITNITPNHLDFHTSMDEYIEAKKNIFLYGAKNSRLVINYDNEITRSFAKEANGSVLFFSALNTANSGVYLKDNTIYIDNDLQEVLSVNDIVIPGSHNVENYMAAIGAVWGITGLDSIKETASSFTGVEHRIEFVRKVEGIRFYNDSIATTPSRAKAGLNSFDKKLILIAGGYDKKIPFDEFGYIICERVKKLILIGDTADKIEKATLDAGSSKGVNIEIVKCDSFEAAVNESYNGAIDGDVVLLSPACASFDMFKNFDERGKRFKEIVKRLKDKNKNYSYE